MLLAVSISLGASAVPESLARRLPRLDAHTLAGRDLVLPDSCAGRVALVALAFRRELAAEVDTWAVEFARRHPEADGFRCYEVPMIGNRVPGFLRGVISAAMRRAVPRDRRGSYAPFFGDAVKYAADFGITDLSVVHVALLDRRGLVRWRASGRPTAAALAALDTAIDGIQE